MTPEQQVLRPTNGTVTDAFDPSLEPVLTVDSGERFTVEALDAHGFTRRPGRPGAPTPACSRTPRATASAVRSPCAAPPPATSSR